MRSLTGQVEELTFQLGKLQEQMKPAQDDNEFRFQELEGGRGCRTPRRVPAAKTGPPAPPTGRALGPLPPAAASDRRKTAAAINRRAGPGEPPVPGHPK